MRLVRKWQKKGLSSRGWMILGAGGVVWLSQDAAGRPAAQGAESKDGGIVGEPGRRPAAGQTLWTQTEVWN